MVLVTAAAYRPMEEAIEMGAAPAAMEMRGSVLREEPGRRAGVQAVEVKASHLLRAGVHWPVATAGLAH